MRCYNVYFKLKFIFDVRRRIQTTLVPPTASTVEDYDYDSDFASGIFNKRSADRPAGSAGGDKGCDCSSIQVYVYFLIGQRLRLLIPEQLNSPSWRTVAIAEAEFLGGI